jgi:hypothetical protein
VEGMCILVGKEASEHVRKESPQCRPSPSLLDGIRPQAMQRADYGG